MPLAPRPPARSRRRSITTFFATALMAASVAVALPGASASAADPTLQQVAASKGKFFGSASEVSSLNEAPYAAILGTEFGQITPANSMKWENTERNQGQFTYSGGQSIVDFAQSHSQTVRGHTLVWHNQLPGWVSQLPASQVRPAMENHIANVAGHFAGDIYAWDVVNEAFNDDGTFRSSPFYNAMGKDYIAYALRAARAADPNAKLYINDYNIDGMGAKSDAMYNLARDLKAAGVPLDGIGIQGHLAVQYGFPYQMQQNFQRFADLGLDVAVTELDVRMQTPSTTQKLATQADYYRQVAAACAAVTRCVGITVWDFTDKYSWVPGTFGGEGLACPWDDQLRPKTQVIDAIRTGFGYDSGPGDTDPPTVPTGLRATGTTSSSVSLAWTASTDDTAVTGYDVYRGGTRVGTASGTTYTDTGLAASTTYSYTVRARDAAGNVSDPSAAAGATTQAGGGEPPAGGLKVQYKTNDTSATDNAVRMTLQLVNTGSEARSLTGVEVRYWFSDQASSYTTWCDWAQLGCGNFTHSVVANGSTAGADHYLRLTATGGNLAPGAATGEIQLRLHKADWSNFNESDDYSKGTATSFTDAPKIGVYVGGQLIWGTAP
ncbi:hypothetical protein SRB5_27380 [Streptomyces sp. RB5]|uniref:Beta-xylanase n=1 Tax=Streptomyces smaragdinus TaxID=2585196 RepID=A0A7K0CHZ3_9ACTN|nr:endo-1,4-beta-xylanase [Streptomyces smaragdinus]MQY12602.1 hypothetical protein [Streptomyces smaragdinus]